MHQRFDRIGRLRPCKFLLVCLLSLHDRDCKHVAQKISIHIQHLDGSLLCLLSSRMGCMPLLPQKFPAPKERARRLLPADHRTPLVIYLWQIPVGLDFIFVKITEQRLRGRTHAEPLLQRFKPAVCHPRNLRRKALHMVFLLLKQTLRYEHWHVYILHPGLFKCRVKLLLNLLPDGIACGFDNHTALHARVVAQLRLLHDICVPLREILLHRGDRLH